MNNWLIPCIITVWGSPQHNVTDLLPRPPKKAVDRSANAGHLHGGYPSLGFRSDFKLVFYPEHSEYLDPPLNRQNVSPQSNK